MCVIDESLNGLHQSLYNGFRTINQCLSDIGFSPLKFDPCVYIYENEVGFVILTLYMDKCVYFYEGELGWLLCRANSAGRGLLPTESHARFSQVNGCESTEVT